MPKLADLTGQRFGRLTCIARAPRIGRDTTWLCICDCGARAIVRTTVLMQGRTKSCGCFRREVTRANHSTHGLSRDCHGRKTRLHTTWQTMKQRCCNVNNPNHKYYGGRGITICGEWAFFKTFHDWAITSGYDSGLTIDRIDNDGNYEPANCRWVTVAEQGLNRSSNRFIRFMGETRTLSQWSARMGIDIVTLHTRLKRSWSVEKALTTRPKATANMEVATNA